MSRDLIVWVVAVVAIANSHPQQSFDKLEYDEDKKCAHDDTICHTSGGCCPTTNAVCCDDMKHCCPEGYICDSEKQQCTREDTSFLYIHQNSSISETKSVSEFIPHVVKCNDKEGSVCPDNNVCCLYKNHIGHGCCEGTRSICCEDREHCCPEGFKCDLKNCVKNVLKMYAPRSILCPDGSTVCKDGDTCCESLVNGTYGCCPKPEAMCCSDKTYCCPHGYSCGLDKCTHSDFSILALAKVPLLPPVNLKTVCPGGSTVCAMNDTCCMHPDKSWGCCPSPNAVCCSDGHHCCPEKYTCDMKDFTCTPIVETFTAVRIQRFQV